MKYQDKIFVDPKNDVAFKKLFGDEHHKSLTINFLNSVLNLSGNESIQAIDFLDSEMLPESINGKKIYLDVYCTDVRGKQFIIEMQTLNEYNFIQRSQMYAARVLSSQLLKGKYYEDLVPVIFLGIVNYTLFEDDSDIISHYSITNTKTGKIVNDSLLTWHYIELSKFHIKVEEVDQLKTIHDKWFYFLKHADDLKAIPKPLQEFKEAFHVIEKLRWSQADLLHYSDAEEIKDRELRIQIGAIQKTAKILLEEGLGLDLIVKATGLSLDEITKLQQVKK